MIILSVKMVQWRMNNMNKKNLIKKVWQVWEEYEVDNKGVIVNDKILFEGSETEARKYYMKHGKNKAGLHLGYVIPDNQ